MISKNREIDHYISAFPEDIQERLFEMRKIINQLAPDAIEKISYQMPTFHLNGNLVHFAAYSNHIGFYPTPSGISQFKKDLISYKHAKGSVQFPHDQPLPIELIKKIVKFRIEENLSKNI